jgi:hypothetical protein
MQNVIIQNLEEGYGPRPDDEARGPQHRIWIWNDVPEVVTLAEEEVPSEWPEYWNLRDQRVRKTLEASAQRRLAALQASIQAT